MPVSECGGIPQAPLPSTPLLAHPRTLLPSPNHSPTQSIPLTPPRALPEAVFSRLPRQYRWFVPRRSAAHSVPVVPPLRVIIAGQLLPRERFWLSPSRGGGLCRPGSLRARTHTRSYGERREGIEAAAHSSKTAERRWFLSFLLLNGEGSGFERKDGRSSRARRAWTSFMRRDEGEGSGRGV